MTAAAAWPVASIGVPVYNGEAYLERALAALAAQTFDALEIVVSDNASTDGTEEIARDFVRRDPRVSYHRSDANRGAAWNFNRTFALARGRYFKWAASDDECRPELVARCVDVLDSGDPSIVLGYPKTVVIDAGSNVVGDFEDELALLEERPSQRLARLLRTSTEYHPIFGLIRTDVLRRTRLIDSFVASDIALLVELAIAGKFYEVPERLFARRFHTNTSVVAHPGGPDRAVWFDPANRGRVVMPMTRLTAAILGSIHRAGLGAREESRCLAAVGRHWLPKHGRDMGGELKSAMAAKTGARVPLPRRARPILPRPVADADADRRQAR